MGAYLKMRIAEIIACIGMCIGLDLAVLSGFDVSDTMAGSPMVVAEVTAVIVFILYLFAFNRTSVGIGVFLGIMVAAASVLYMHSADPLADEAANGVFILALVCLVTCLLAFLLTRTKPGAFVALALGTVVCAGAAFLEFPIPLGGFILFVVCAVLMIFLRVYTNTFKRAITGFIKEGRYFGQSIGMTALACLLAFGVFFAVIVPLNPPTRDLELIQALRNMQTVDVFGLSQTRDIYDPSLLSSGALADQQEGSLHGDEDSETPEGQQDKMRQEDQDPNEGSDKDTMQDKNWIVNPELIEYLTAIQFGFVNLLGLIIAAIVVVAIVLVITVKLLLRRRWRRKVSRLPNNAAIANFYQGFLHKFDIIGIGRAPNMTLTDYARVSKQAMEPFTVNGISFAELTGIYQAVYYGGAGATENDVQKFEAFYKHFYKGTRKQIGVLKYLRKFFRL